MRGHGKHQRLGIHTDIGGRLPTKNILHAKKGYVGRILYGEKRTTLVTHFFFAIKTLIFRKFWKLEIFNLWEFRFCKYKTKYKMRLWTQENNHLKTCNMHIWRFENLKFRNFENLRNEWVWNVENAAFRIYENLKYWNFEKLKLRKKWKYETLRIWNFESLNIIKINLWTVQNFENLKISNLENFEIWKFERFQISNFQISTAIFFSIF